MNFLIDHLWQSTLFGAVILVLAYVLRRHSARTRHSLWLAASLKFLVPFSLLVSAGAQFELPSAIPLPTARSLDQVESSFEPSVRIDPLLPATANSWWPQALAGLWAIGSLVLFGRWTKRWIDLQEIVRGATPLNISAPVPVLSSSSSIEPGIFGILRPVLVLPEGILQTLSSAELDAILAHELAHVRRRDNLSAALHMFVESIFWFHPLTWWIGSKLIEERENACDEEVLRLGKQPQVYAEGILNVCRYYLQSPLPCASGVSGADLRHRIAAILSPRVSLQMTLAQKLILGALLTGALTAPIVIGVLKAQDLPPCHDCKFEVASIRPTAPGQGRGSNMHTDRARFTTRNTSLWQLIQFAYRVRDYQLSGGPEWVRDERFDIAAKFDETETDRIPAADLKRAETRNARIRARLRDMLAERFQLGLREETKDLPIYALTLEKGGHKMNADPEGKGNMNTHSNNGVGQLVADGVPIASLCDALAGILGRPVIDETGLQGIFSMKLNWADNAAEDGSGASIFTAVRDQLGLRLQSKKGPVVTYVIERVEKPTEN